VHALVSKGFNFLVSPELGKPLLTHDYNQNNKRTFKDFKLWGAGRNFESCSCQPSSACFGVTFGRTESIFHGHEPFQRIGELHQL
jgi:hypothetical protein